MGTDEIPFDEVVGITYGSCLICMTCKRLIESCICKSPFDVDFEVLDAQRTGAVEEVQLDNTGSDGGASSERSVGTDQLETLPGSILRLPEARRSHSEKMFPTYDLPARSRRPREVREERRSGDH